MLQNLSATARIGVGAVTSVALRNNFMHNNKNLEKIIIIIIIIIINKKK
jgi:hypothetical protein